MTPAELRGIREGFNLGQTEFALLTGIAESLLREWEQGRLLQSRAMDSYMRVLTSNSENVRFLEKASFRANGRTAGVSPVVSQTA